MDTAQAVDALTDVALFITVYVSVVATIFALGEPRTKGETMGRAIGLWMCAVTGGLLVVWLFLSLLIHLGVLAGVH